MVRVAAVAGGALLGLTVTLPATAALAAPGPGPTGPEATATTPHLPDPGVEAADTTTSTSTSTTSSTSSTSTTSTTTTTTTTLPGPPITSSLIPPLVVDGRRVEVGDVATTSRTRSRVRPRVATDPGPTLPLTGDSSFSVLAAGLGALAIGGAAVWWGSRRTAPADPAEAGNPPATG